MSAKGGSVYRPTGQGQHDVFFKLDGANVMEARLSNFDFDDFADKKIRPLKKDHSDFLSEQVVPLLEDNKGNIWLQGSASRIGQSGWNMTLSMVRAGAVQAFLLDNGAQQDQIVADAVGNTLTARHGLDDPEDRSVFLWVYPRITLHRPPKKVPRPPLTRQFKIAVDGQYPKRWVMHHQNISLGAKILGKLVKKIPISPNDVPFLILDTENRLACRYVYIDVGIGFSSTIGSSGPELHGPWTSFVTDKPIGCWQFGRGAHMTSLAGGKNNKNYIHIETPEGLKDVDAEVDTGGGVIGAEGHFGILGDFDLMEGPAPFVGP
jgi:hypothetical protein